MKKIISLFFIFLALVSFASCKSKAKKYKIQFLQDDQKTVIYSYDCKEGEQIVFTGEKPTKPEDDKFTYTFKEWDHELGLASKDENFYAVYTQTEKNSPNPNPNPNPVPQPVELKGDILNCELVKITGNSYADYTYEGESGAEYALTCAQNAATKGIQITNKEGKDAGIITTKSAGSVKSVTVAVAKEQYGTRVINIFGYNEEYSSVADFIDAAVSPITSFTFKSSEKDNNTFTYTFTESYAYVAILSAGDDKGNVGAVSLDNVSIEWKEAEPIVIEPVDQAFKDAMQNFDVSNVKYVYTIKGTGDYSDYNDRSTYYWSDGKLKYEYTNVDMFGDSTEECIFLYEDETTGKTYLVMKAQDESDDYGDWGDIDWESFDFSQFGKSARKVSIPRLNAENDTETDEYYYITSDDEAFETTLSYLQLMFLNIEDYELDFDDFEKIGQGRYQVKADRINEVAKTILGDSDDDGDYEDEDGQPYHYTATEVFVSGIIEVKEGKISKFIFKSNFTETSVQNGETTTYKGNFTYTFEFSDFGQVSFEIPAAKKYIAEPKVSTIYQLENGDSITIAAYVNGINTSEKLLYVCDETGAIAVKYDELETVPVVGGTVEITGTVSVTGNVYEFIASSIKVNNENPEKMMNATITGVDGKDYTYAGETVDFNYLTVVSKDIENNNVIFEGYDGISYKLLFEESEKTTIANLLKDIEANTSVNAKNFAIAYTSEGFALRVLDNAVVELANGLIVDKTDITVELNTTKENALAEIHVFAYDSGVKSTLPSTGYEVLGDYEGAKIGTYLLTIKKDDFTAPVSIRVNYADGTAAFIETNGKGIEYVNQKYANAGSGLKATGDVEILVIPVAFEGQTYASNYKEVLEKGFNGTSEQTGWESLHSYYYKTSYGKLNFHATIKDAWECGDPYKADESKLEGYSQLDYKYLDKAIKYYDNEIDYNTFDSNKDGYIDTVFLVYLAPYDSQSSDSNNIWWAYNYQFFETSDEEVRYDGLGLDFYMWFSYDFFTDSMSEVVDNQLVTVASPTVNCETVIHETGHSLGLDDYYDTTYSGNGGCGGGVMMDANVGDHDPYAKAILGWIEPWIVINQNAEIEIESFEASGQAIFIAKDYDGVFFNEYYIVDFYTPTGLNQIQAGHNGLPSIQGVRILHVNATPKADASQISGAWGLTEASNSNPDNKLISIVEADENSSIGKGEKMVNEDLWQAGQTLSGMKWHDGTDCNFSISIISIENGKAKISVNFAE